MQPHEAVGTTVAGKFRVISLRGRGGMGDVFEVEHVFTKRIGALKVLNKECAAQPAIVERFIREASAAGRIGNPHIVEMVDAGISDQGVPYLFMELLQGVSLETLIEQRKRLTIADALHIILQAAQGLAAAHAVQIIHRDIKPANLFILDPEGKRQVKILDFGISKFSGNEVSGLTQTGAAMGTPLYMPFEQLLSSSQVDARADVYSLAVVLYECITGRVPFNAESLVALSLVLQRGEFESARALRADVPPALDALLQRSLSPIREKRPSDMGSFADELVALIDALKDNAGAFSGAETQLIAIAPPAATGLKSATTAAMSSALGARQKPAQNRQATTALGAGAVVLILGSLGYRFLGSSTVNNANPNAVSVTEPPPAQPSSQAIAVASAPPAEPSAAAAQASVTTVFSNAEPALAANGGSEAATSSSPAASSTSAAANSTLRAAPARPVANGAQSSGSAARSATNPGRIVSGVNAGATPAAPRSGLDKRCARLVERESLGETLTAGERNFLRQSCGAK